MQRLMFGFSPCAIYFINMTGVFKVVFLNADNAHVIRLFVNCFPTLTCCFSTKFFTPSITNCDPVFITSEKRLKNKIKTMC